MYDIITAEEFRRLASIEAQRCVSIYLPTHRAGAEVAADRICLKNLIADARRELEEVGVRSPEAAALLRPVEARLHDAAFWTRNADGLAVFVSNGDTEVIRLPGSVEPAATVAGRLRLAPLIPFISRGDDFHILALSENQVRLLRAGRYQVSAVDLGDTPASLADALPYDDREPQLHSHGSDRVGSGRVSAAFHGHGGAGDFEASDLERFLNIVDRGLHGIIGDGPEPMVLAGVEEIVSRFRNLSTQTNIAEAYIRGNPDDLSITDLHDRSLQLAAPLLNAKQDKARHRLGSHGAATAESVSDVVLAATGGRVDALFLVRGASVWGSFDSDDRSVDVHSHRGPGDDDLLDLAAVATLEHGGEVFIFDQSEMPVGGFVAALLRY